MAYGNLNVSPIGCLYRSHRKEEIGMSLIEVVAIMMVLPFVCYLVLMIIACLIDAVNWWRERRRNKDA